MVNMDAIVHTSLVALASVYDRYSFPLQCHLIMYSVI